MAVFWSDGYTNPNLTITQSNVLLPPDFAGLTELTASQRAILVFDVTSGGIVKVLNAVSSSYAAHAVTASFAPTSSYVNPYVGQTRFNTATNKLQFWNGTAWTQVPLTALTP